MYFYGTVNGIEALLISPAGAHFSVARKLRFAYTNNMVEYEACIVSLKAAVDMNIEDLELYGDLY